MAKLQKKSNDTYEFWVDLGRDPVTGKRRQVHRSGFKTKKEAENEIRRLQNEADNGIFIEKKKSQITFEEFSQVWFEYYKTTSGNKQSTIDSRKHYLSLINKMIGSVKMQDFTRPRYEKFLAEVDKVYSKNTLESIHTIASMLFAYATECNIIPVDPSANAKKPKRAKTLEDIQGDIQEKYFSRDELTRFLNTVKDYGDLQYYALFRLLAYSGMRIGEVIALEIDKLDFKTGQIKVRQTCYCPTKNTCNYILQTPKTVGSIRDIDIDAETLSLLRLQINDQKKRKMQYRNTWHDAHDFVFTSEKYPGYPVPYNLTNRAFKRFLRLAEIDNDLTLHSLRHTHASLLAESGATLEQIQERLGHESSDITRRIYLHVTKDAKSAMVANFAKFMAE